MKTRLTRSRSISTCWSLSTARICPTISPALRLRFSPSSAVMQKAHSTAHPTWLETQMVARCQPFRPGDLFEASTSWSHPFAKDGRKDGVPAFCGKVSSFKFRVSSSRDRVCTDAMRETEGSLPCLLYTSDAADEEDSVD